MESYGMKEGGRRGQVCIALTILLGVVALGSSGCGSPTSADTENGVSASAALALVSEEPTCVTLQRGTNGQVADAKISNWQPGKNFGDEPVAALSLINEHREHLLLRFDTSSIPQKATVTSATLTLWQVNSGRPSSLRAHAVTGPWAEESVTWNGFGSAFDASVAASLGAPGAANPASRTLDISSLVASWVREPALNRGLLLEQPEGKSVLDTSESPHAERRPRLEVCYTVSSVPTNPKLPAGTSLLLQIVDSEGNAISKAAISSRNAVFATDGEGRLLFENLQPGRFLARVDALGYTSASVVVELQEGAHAGYQVKLLPLGTPITFQAEQGGIIATERVRVFIPPNAVVDALGQPVTGPVDVTIVPLEPTTQMANMPGPLEGTTAADGELVQLESFAMAEVGLWHNGAPVQLAPGASANLEFVLSDAVASHFQSGDTVPAWWFDLDAGQWREEGVGTIQPSQSQPDKMAWNVSVHHFTWWNCDAPSTDKSCVDVLVVDESGKPIPNAQVNAIGTSYTGFSHARYTGSDGRTCIEIKRSGTADIFAGFDSNLGSEVVSVTGTSAAAVCGSGSCTPVTLVMKDVICTPGAYQECPYSGPADALGKGRCQAGRQQCNTTGTAWSSCSGEVLPTAESCSTFFDDDCDGQMNEDCTCSDQEGSSCYTGAADTQGKGICRDGVVACDLFGRFTCSGQQLPRTENCLTSEDDDCDGSTECKPVTRWLWRPDGTGCTGVQMISLSGDGQGNTVVLGSLAGTLDLGGPLSSAGGSDRFVAKFNANGQPVWSRLIERTSYSYEYEYDRGDVLTVDGAGNVLISGNFNGSLRIDGHELTSQGYSIFVVKLSTAGDLIWAQSFGGDGGDALSSAWVASIATGPAGQVAISGDFIRSLKIGDTVHQHDLGYSIPKAYVLKLDGGTGAPIWSKSYYPQRIGGVAVDGEGDVLMGGSFSGGIYLDGVLVLFKYDQSQENFVMKLNGSTGAFIWGKDVGPGGNVYVNNVRTLRADRAGNVLVLKGSALMKLGTAGEQLWSTNIGSFLNDAFHTPSLIVDASGNFLIAGTFKGEADLGGGMRGNTIGLPNAFLAWYDANGNYLSDKVFAGHLDWSKGNIGYAYGIGADTDDTGNAVFAGEFSGFMDFGTGTMRPQGSCGDVVLLKLDPTP